MKKLSIATLIYVVFLIVVSVVNNVVLLNLHPYSYYYTIDGLKLALIVAGIETAIIVPGSKLFFMKFLGEKKFYKIFGDKEDES